MNQSNRNAAAPIGPGRGGERAAWIGAYAVCAGTVLLRVPSVTTSIRRRVDEEIASGALIDTTQRALAVNVGVTLAVALTCAMLAVLFAVVRRVDRRLRLPQIGLASRMVPGALVVLSGIWLVKQVVVTIRQPVDPLTDPLLWVTCLTFIALVAVALGRLSASRGRGRVQLTVLCLGLAVALV